MDQQHLARQPPLSVSVVVELEKGTCNEEGLGAVVRACTRVLASDAKTCRIGSEHVSGLDGPCIQESPQALIEFSFFKIKSLPIISLILFIFLADSRQLGDGSA